MSSAGVASSRGLSWVRWWARCARQADASWGLDARLVALLDGRASAQIDQCLGMRCRLLPPPPNLPLLSFLELHSELQQVVCELVVCVCAGDRKKDYALLDVQDIKWCRRIAGSLRPGGWMPSNWCAGSIQVRALFLLRGWAGEWAWSRVRLMFAAHDILQAEQLSLVELPAQRLAMLWQSVLCYAHYRSQPERS